MSWGEFAEILTVVGTLLVPIFGMLKWFFSRLDKKFEKIENRFIKIDEKFDRIDERFNKVDEKFDRILSILSQQGHRLSRMEGYLEGRDVHIKATGTEEKK